MQADYKRDLNHNYLILQEEGEVDTASYEVRMILMNSISGLLPCTIQRIDNQNLFYYEITSRQPISLLFANKKLGRKELHPLLTSMVEVIKTLGSYLLDPGHLLFNPEYIYEDAGGDGTYFCFLPVYKGEAIEGMRDFMEYLLPKIDHQDPEAVRIGYGVYHCVMEENFQLEQMEKELYTVREKDEPQEEEPEAEEILRQVCREPLETEYPRDKGTIKTAAVVTGGSLLIGGGFLAWNYRYIPWNYLAAGFGGLAVLAGAAGLVWYRLQKKELGNLGWKEESSQDADQNTDAGWPDRKIEDWEKQNQEKETSHKESYRESYREKEETSLLTSFQGKPAHWLRAKRGGEEADIRLNKGVILIGKMEEAVDYCILLPTVSRIHCKLELTEDICRIQDLNSKNGTFVNGRLLEGREQRQLMPGDEVMIADVIFYYE